MEAKWGQSPSLLLLSPSSTPSVPLRRLPLRLPPAPFLPPPPPSVSGFQGFRVQVFFVGFRVWGLEPRVRVTDILEGQRGDRGGDP